MHRGTPSSHESLSSEPRADHHPAALPAAHTANSRRWEVHMDKRLEGKVMLQASAVQKDLTVEEPGLWQPASHAVAFYFCCKCRMTF